MRKGEGEWSRRRTNARIILAALAALKHFMELRNYGQVAKGLI